MYIVLRSQRAQEKFWNDFGQVFRLFIKKVSVRAEVKKYLHVNVVKMITVQIESTFKSTKFDGYCVLLERLP